MTLSSWKNPTQTRVHHGHTDMGGCFRRTGKKTNWGRPCLISWRSLLLMSVFPGSGSWPTDGQEMKQNGA